MNNRHSPLRKLCARAVGFAALMVAFGPCQAMAAAPYDEPAWSRPVTPFRIVGNIYYVGTEGLAAYLIVSKQGDVLLDGTLARNVPVIERNIKRLGFRIRDVKVLINSHAHYDHAAGFARLKRDTGAKLWISAGDRDAVEQGRQEGDMDYGVVTFPGAKADTVVDDGQTLRVGDIALTALMTPGHTRGCTTWLMPVRDHGRTLQVAFPGSVSVAGNILVGNRSYPGIVADYRASFARLKAVKAQVTLPAHPELADVLHHARQRKAGTTDAFVDPEKLGEIVDAAQADFEKQLASQIAKPHQASSIELVSP